MINATQYFVGDFVGKLMVGDGVGIVVGEEVGTVVGDTVGTDVGETVGVYDGNFDGMEDVGLADGNNVLLHSNWNKEATIFAKLEAKSNLKTLQVDACKKVWDNWIAVSFKNKWLR